MTKHIFGRDNGLVADSGPTLYLINDYPVPQAKYTSPGYIQKTFTTWFYQRADSLTQVIEYQSLYGVKHASLYWIPLMIAFENMDARRLQPPLSYCDNIISSWVLGWVSHIGIIRMAFVENDQIEQTTRWLQYHIFSTAHISPSVYYFVEIFMAVYWSYAWSRLLDWACH